MVGRQMDRAAREPRSSDFWKVADQLFDQLQEAGATLAVSKSVEPEVEVALKRLVAALPADPEVLGGADPYLVSALYASTTKCLQALGESDPELRRREFRIPFERTRQALRGLLAERPHPSLKGEEPQALLRDADPEGGPKLLRLANGTRSMSLT
jgi:hypothetical protein